MNTLTKMLHKALVLVLFTIFSSCGIYGAATKLGGKQVAGPTSILNLINTDTNICDTPKIAVLQSQYVSKCKEVLYPSTNSTSLLENVDMFLCLGLYDRTYHICHYRSLELKVPSLVNKTIFESLMDNQIKKVSKSLEVCSSFLSEIETSFYDKTKPFVDQLSKGLKNPKQCVNICSDDQGEKINPLCLVIQLIDQIVRKEILEMKTPGVTGNSQNSQAPAGSDERPATDDQHTLSKTETNPAAQSADSNHNSPELNKDTVKHSGQSTANNQQINKINAKKDMVKDKLKTIVADEKSKEDKVEKANSLPRGQSSSQDEKQPPKKVENIPMNGPAVSHDGDSPSQIMVPEKNLSEEKSSTVSENTANGEIVEGSDPEGGPAEMDPDEDVTNALQKELNEVKEPIKDVSQEAVNIPKPLRIPDDDSHFFGYFTVFGFLAFSLFLAYHHKHKIFAMLLEGRRARGGRARRRPSTANYRKLDCTLEEAVTSQCSSNVTHVIY